MQTKDEFTFLTNPVNSDQQTAIYAQQREEKRG